MRRTMFGVLAVSATAAHAQVFGGFGPPVLTSVPAAAGAIYACDLNHDGVPDLIAAGLNTGVITVMIGAADGTFATNNLSPGINGAAGVVVADFNGDGDRDVAIADQTAANVVLLPGNGLGALGSPVNIPTPTPIAELDAADIDNDGDVDLVIARIDAIFLLNDGDANFSVGATIPVAFQFASTVRLIDLNADGLPEAVLTDLLAAEFLVAINLGDGEFAFPETYPIGDDFVFDIDAFDADDDGDIDLVLTGEDITVMKNIGDATFFISQIINVTGAATDAADLEGDGDIDFVSNVGGSLTPYLNNGLGAFAPQPAIPGGAQPSTVVLATVNPGPIPDLINLAFNDSQVRVAFGLSVNVLPKPFALLAPADGADNLPLPDAANDWGGGALLTWEKSQGVGVSYHLTVTDSQNHDVINLTGIEGTSYLLASGLLVPGETYVWGVEAANGVGATFSTPISASFTIACPADTNQDGALNILDFVTFQGLFLKGCGL